MPRAPARTRTRTGTRARTRQLTQLAVGLVVVGVLLGVRACGDDGARESRDAVPPDTASEEVLEGLCRAVDAAGEDDLGRAEAEFGDVHARLHEVADALTETDRSGAAEVLRAKEAVERGFAAERAEATTSGPKRLASGLRALADEVAAATDAGTDAGTDAATCS